MSLYHLKASVASQQIPASEHHISGPSLTGAGFPWDPCFLFPWSHPVVPPPQSIHQPGICRLFHISVPLNIRFPLPEHCSTRSSVPNSHCLLRPYSDPFPWVKTSPNSLQQSLLSITTLPEHHVHTIAPCSLGYTDCNCFYVCLLETIKILKQPVLFIFTSLVSRTLPGR